MIFVNSMSDLFHESVPDGWIMQVLAIMARCPQHRFQILTKRSKRMRKFMTKWADLDGEDFEPKLVNGPEETRKAHPSGRGQLFADMLESMGPVPKGAAYPAFDWLGGMINWPDALSNVWLGVSCEDQTRADERVPDLLKTPAAIRFVSAEPLLGPINFAGGGRLADGRQRGGYYWLTERPCPVCKTADKLLKPREAFSHPINCGWRMDNAPAHDKWNRRGIDWIIVGGESGKNFRPMQMEWAHRIHDDCKRAGTKFFFKQDCGPKSGKQGRASNELWNCKEFPQ